MLGIGISVANDKMPSGQNSSSETQTSLAKSKAVFNRRDSAASSNCRRELLKRFGQQFLCLSFVDRSRSSGFVHLRSLSFFSRNPVNSQRDTRTISLLINTDVGDWRDLCGIPELPANNRLTTFNPLPLRL